MDVKEGFGEAIPSSDAANEISHEQIEMGDEPSDGKDSDQNFEVFGNSENGVNFRVLNWQWASIIFLKLTFATGVMAIPGQMYILGAAPGALVVLGWGIINTYAGVVQGNFRARHPMCHSVADMAQIIGGPICRETAGACFIVSWIIVAGSAINGASTALNALSDHAICTNWYSLIIAVAIMVVASIRKFGDLSWVSWVGFILVFAAVFIVVIGVTLRDRPAGAPQTGNYDFGYIIIASPTFSQGISAAVTIFSASAGTSAFLPVISEMRRPNDYSKALYTCMLLVTSSYLSFGVVVYKWCGKWVTTPSLGSAGPTLKKASYGVGLVGIAITGCLYVHVSAKYVFVRILRKSVHLQSNSFVHWATWLSCTIGLSIVAFLLAAAIPIFNYLLGLAGSLGFAPIALILPPWLWIFDHQDWRTASIVKSCVYYMHCVWVLIGVFITVGGTYGIIQSIINAYYSGKIGSAFSCADNSNST